MRVFKVNEFLEMDNPTPGKMYKEEILSQKEGAIELGGLFGLFVGGDKGRYHFHEKRESILYIIEGEATELVEGKEIPIKAGDILYIPPGEKHTIVNRSNNDLRYIEFFTHPPVGADIVVVK